MLVGTDAFVGLAKLASATAGLPGLRRIVLKHPVNTLNGEQLADVQKAAMAGIIVQLTEGR